MSFYYLDERSYAKFLEIVRWFDAVAGSAAGDGTPDQLANRVVPFKLVSDPSANDDGLWTAKGMQLYYDGTRKYEADTTINSHQAELFFPLCEEKPAFVTGDRVFCIDRGRWEVVSPPAATGISIHAGVAVSPINYGYDPENKAHGGDVREFVTNSEGRAFAGMLKPDESISSGRRVEWVRIDGVNRIINAECEP